MLAKVFLATQFMRAWNVWFWFSSSKLLQRGRGRSLLGVRRKGFSLIKFSICLDHLCLFQLPGNLTQMRPRGVLGEVDSFTGSLPPPKKRLLCFADESLKSSHPTDQEAAELHIPAALPRAPRVRESTNVAQPHAQGDSSGIVQVKCRENVRRGARLDHPRGPSPPESCFLCSKKGERDGL